MTSDTTGSSCILIEIQASANVTLSRAEDEESVLTVCQQRGWRCRINVDRQPFKSSDAHWRKQSGINVLRLPASSFARAADGILVKTVVNPSSALKWKHRQLQFCQVSKKKKKKADSKWVVRFKLPAGGKWVTEAQQVRLTVCWQQVDAGSIPASPVLTSVPSRWFDLLRSLFVCDKTPNTSSIVLSCSELLPTLAVMQNTSHTHKLMESYRAYHRSLLR